MGHSQSTQWSAIADEFSVQIRDEKVEVLAPACLKLLRQFQACLPEHSLALDFGGGDGFLLSQIVPDTDFQWTYYDPSAQQNKKAENNNSPKVNFTGDLKNCHFDIIMCNHVINTMESEAELLKLFQLFHGIISDNGRIIITLNHPHYLTRKHQYYRCSSPQFNADDGEHVTMQVNNESGGKVIFSDIYWTLNTIISNCRKARLSHCEKHEIITSGRRYPSYLQLILKKTDDGSQQ